MFDLLTILRQVAILFLGGSQQRAENLSMLKYCTILLILVTILLACSDEKSTNDRLPIEPNLLDETISLVGYHCICWDQRIGGAQVAAGTYSLRMVAASFDWTSQFTIDASAASQPAWQCCDTSTVSINNKIHKDPPTHFGFEISATAYAPGDTVAIELAIPAPAEVKLQVKRIE